MGSYSLGGVATEKVSSPCHAGPINRCATPADVGGHHQGLYLFSHDAARCGSSTMAPKSRGSPSQDTIEAATNTSGRFSGQKVELLLADKGAGRWCR